jgi:hypothetical protein
MPGVVGSIRPATQHERSSDRGDEHSNAFVEWRVDVVDLVNAARLQRSGRCLAR